VNRLGLEASGLGHALGGAARWSAQRGPERVDAC
jgi:hypothetical protein